MTQPFETPSQLPDDLAAATSVVVEAGDAFDTYPYTERPELLTIRDVEVVQQLLAELAAADLTPGVTLPVLCGLRLTFRDDAENHVGSVGVLTAGWLRNWWSSDALLPVGLSLLRDENSDLHQYLRTGWQAADAVTPAHAAARDSGGQEHAMGDTETLCGLPGASVEVYRHHFAFRADDCSDCYRLAWDRNDPPPWPKVYESAAALSIRWADRWGVTPPVGHMLRGRDTWVRFHSLPESKRYADTTEESDEILRRHHTLLNELAATTGSREVLVLTLSWSCSQQPVPQAAPLQAALPGSPYWASFQDPDDPEDDVWNHVFVNRLPLTPAALDPLLRLVADDGTAGVIICDENLTWFFHPYDGGADVIAATTPERDELKARHHEWLPATESGL